MGSDGDHDGVGDLIITIPNEGTLRCTGSLLSTGTHVLTAAHCVTNSSGNFVSGTAGTITLPAVPDETSAISTFRVHPNWDGDSLRGNDVAVLAINTNASGDVIGMTSTAAPATTSAQWAKSTGMARQASVTQVLWPTHPVPSGRARICTMPRPI